MTAPDTEGAARAICSGYWLLREYVEVLAPSTTAVTPDQWQAHRSRLGWLLDHLGNDVGDLSMAVWGEQRHLMNSDHEEAAAAAERGVWHRLRKHFSELETAIYGGEVHRPRANRVQS